MDRIGKFQGEFSPHHFLQLFSTWMGWLETSTSRWSKCREEKDLRFVEAELDLMISTLFSTHWAQTIWLISVIKSWSEKLPNLTKKLWCCRSKCSWNWTESSCCIVVSATILLRDRSRKCDTGLAPPWIKWMNQVSAQTSCQILCIFRAGRNEAA